MKLRNADMETDADGEKGQNSRREPLVRLVFRSATIIREAMGIKKTIVLQVSSVPICCGRYTDKPISSSYIVKND